MKERNLYETVLLKSSSALFNAISSLCLLRRMEWFIELERGLILKWKMYLNILHISTTNVIDFGIHLNTWIYLISSKVLLIDKPDRKISWVWIITLLGLNSRNVVSFWNHFVPCLFTTHRKYIRASFWKQLIRAYINWQFSLFL